MPVDATEEAFGTLETDPLFRAGAVGRSVDGRPAASFVVMRELKLREAVTTDRHFRQMGFQVLP